MEKAEGVSSRRPHNQNGGEGREHSSNGDATTWISDAIGQVEEFAKERPLAAVGMAAAAGFLIGGGLAPSTLFRLAGFTLRTAARETALNLMGLSRGSY